MKTECWNSSWP